MRTESMMVCVVVGKRSCSVAMVPLLVVCVVPPPPPPPPLPPPLPPPPVCECEREEEGRTKGVKREDEVLVEPS
jgi:hypothetical protein